MKTSILSIFSALLVLLITAGSVSSQQLQTGDENQKESKTTTTEHNQNTSGASTAKAEKKDGTEVSETAENDAELDKLEKEYEEAMANDNLEEANKIEKQIEFLKKAAKEDKPAYTKFLITEEALKDAPVEMKEFVEMNTEYFEIVSKKRIKELGIDYNLEKSFELPEEVLNQLSDESKAFIDKYTWLIIDQIVK